MDKWGELKEYLEMALNEGYDCEYYIEENTQNKGQFMAYQKIMDEMKKIESIHLGKFLDVKADKKNKV